MQREKRPKSAGSIVARASDVPGSVPVEFLVLIAQKVMLSPLALDDSTAMVLHEHNHASRV